MFGAIEGEEAIGFPMPGSENYVDVSSVILLLQLITLSLMHFCQQTKKSSSIFSMQPIVTENLNFVKMFTKTHEVV